MKKDRKDGREITIVGYVMEIEEDDEIVGVEISTEDDDYIVEMNKMGKELLDFINRDVEVTGIVQRGENGISRITLRDYEVLDEPEDDEYDYDYDYDDDEPFDD